MLTQSVNLSGRGPQELNTMFSMNPKLLTAYLLKEGLDRLWQSERNLPTPNEVDAPGLWLARIDLPDEPPGL